MLGHKFDITLGRFQSLLNVFAKGPSNHLGYELLGFVELFYNLING
jgi:hypothetical protein